MAFVSVDRDYEYVIPTVSSLNDRQSNSHWQWGQPELILEEIDLSDNKDAVHQKLIVPQLEVCEIYFHTCCVIDHYNQHYQDTLQM